MEENLTVIMSVVLALNSMQLLFVMFMLPMIIRQGNRITAIETVCGMQHRRTGDNIQ